MHILSFTTNQRQYFDRDSISSRQAKYCFFTFKQAQNTMTRVAKLEHIHHNPDTAAQLYT